MATSVTSTGITFPDATTQTTAAASEFTSGTVMLFAQTAAPTGWTKNTASGNNHALRVVTGTASTGGSVDFTTAFASQTPTGSVTITSVSGSAGATTLSTPQIPSHAHTQRHSGNLRFSEPNYGQSDVYPDGNHTVGSNSSKPTSNASTTTANAGGGGSHTHPFSFSSGSGTFSGSAINLAVKYVDVIRATKD